MQRSAYRAGLKPHEFWDLTPHEANVFIEESGKNRITVAWQHAALHRLAKTKKFPNSPDKLLPRKRKHQSPEEMVAMLKAHFGIKE